MSLSAWFECFTGCGVVYPLEQIVYRCEKCGGLLEVRHDVEALQKRSPSEWKQLFDGRLGRESGVWSKKEVVLPNLRGESVVSLGEGNSPLIRSQALAKEYGVADLWIKQCGTSHTGSFKDLGMTVLVSMVNEIRSKVRAVACASTGDTSAALAAYCAAAGLPSIVFLPKDKVSIAQLIQPLANGAITISIDTDFDGCMKIVQEITKDGSIYLANSMNSLRVEGQKTISFEIVQQLGWEVPDFIVLPGGNLGNVSAVCNGFVMLKQMGLVDRIPVLVCAQTEKANPFYRSYVSGFKDAESMVAGETLASAIRIGNPVSFPKAVRAMKASNGIVEQVTEAELADAAHHADRFGFFNDPHTGVALGATRKLIKSGKIPKSAKVVVISTAHGLKFVDFKLKFHKKELPGTSAALSNLPIEVPSNADAVRKAIDGRLPA
jgi:threonine synthase